MFMWMGMFCVPPGGLSSLLCFPSCCGNPTERATLLSGSNPPVSLTVESATRCMTQGLFIPGDWLHPTLLRPDLSH